MGYLGSEVTAVTAAGSQQDVVGRQICVRENIFHLKTTGTFQMHMLATSEIDVAA